MNVSDFLAATTIRSPGRGIPFRVLRKRYEAAIGQPVSRTGFVVELCKAGIDLVAMPGNATIVGGISLRPEAATAVTGAAAQAEPVAA